MNTDDAIEHFGSRSAIAAVLGITRQAVYHWHAQVPLLSALRLEKATRRKLRVDLSEYKHGGRTSKAAKSVSAKTRT